MFVGDTLPNTAEFQKGGRNIWQVPGKPLPGALLATGFPAADGLSLQLVGADPEPVEADAPNQ